MQASLMLRGLRAAVFAALCVALAAAGHGLAAHSAPTLRADAVGSAAVFGLGWLLGARERSLAGIAAAMAATQIGLHLFFSSTSAAAGTSLAQNAMAGMHHTALVTATAPHAMGGRAVAAHAVAGLLASCWLRRGEAAVWSLLRQVAALVPGLAAGWWTAVRPPPAPADVQVRRFGVGQQTVRQLLLRHAVIRRGPPTAGPGPVPVSFL